MITPHVGVRHDDNHRTNRGMRCRGGTGTPGMGGQDPTERPLRRLARGRREETAGELAMESLARRRGCRGRVGRLGRRPRGSTPLSEKMAAPSGDCGGRPPSPGRFRWGPRTPAPSRTPGAGVVPVRFPSRRPCWPAGVIATHRRTPETEGAAEDRFTPRATRPATGPDAAPEEATWPPGRGPSAPRAGPAPDPGEKSCRPDALPVQHRAPDAAPRVARGPSALGEGVRSRGAHCRDGGTRTGETPAGRAHRNAIPYEDTACVSTPSAARSRRPNLA